MHERLRIDVKVERGFSFLRPRTTFHTLPLYHLYTQKLGVTKTKTLENEDLRPKTRLSFRDYEN